MSRWRILGIFVGVLVPIASPRLAQACKRWNSPFDPCIKYPGECAAADAGDFEARKFITGLTWTETAKEACENWGIEGNDGKAAEIVEGGEDDPFVYCNFVTDPNPVPQLIQWQDITEASIENYLAILIAA